jgi:hypothetical protein
MFYLPQECALNRVAAVPRAYIMTWSRFPGADNTGTIALAFELQWKQNNEVTDRCQSRIHCQRGQNVCHVPLRKLL